MMSPAQIFKNVNVFPSLKVIHNTHKDKVHICVKHRPDCGNFITTLYQTPNVCLPFLIELSQKVQI